MPNPLRIEGPDPPAMTCKDVERWLVAVFADYPETSVYSAPALRISALDSNVAPGPLYWLEFASDVLGARSPEFIALLTWARARARRRIRKHRRLRSLKDVPGGTITDYCAEFGIWRRTFDRRRKRACERVAEAWNARPS